MSQEIDLEEIFQSLNAQHFDGSLELPVLKWNGRLRIAAGRFIPGKRQFFQTKTPVIEIASYLKSEDQSFRHVWDTMGHEMIHYWLWSEKKPYGHTKEFKEKMKSMGVTRYNPVPKRRAYKYIYICPQCEQTFPTRKKMNPPLACRKCCQNFNEGAYDSKYMLRLQETLE